MPPTSYRCAGWPTRARPRDRALFWLIYDGGLRCQEALAINLEDIDWTERAIRIQGKGDRSREMFFSRRVSCYLDDYLKQLEEVHAGLGPAPAAPHGHQRVSRPRLQRDRAQTFQWAPVPAQPRGLYRSQP